MSEIKVPKDEMRKLTTLTTFQKYRNYAVVAIGAMSALFGVQKAPIINESSRIAEASEVVRNLTPDQMIAMQGVQIIALEKKVDANAIAQLQATESLKEDIRNIVKEYRDQTNARLDKHSLKLDTYGNSISRLEVLVPRARANN